MHIVSPGMLLAASGMLFAQGEEEGPDLTLDPDLTVAGERLNVEFGSGFATTGDIDGDGVADFAVADRSAMVNGQISSGSTYIVSGADGSFLRTYDGIPARSQYFGSSLAGLDSDGDGVSDLAVGSPGRADADGRVGAGAVTVYSGANGSVLWVADGATSSQFGTTMANAGDQNGDGVDDLFVGAPLGDAARGQVLTVSGADGAIIRVLGTSAAPYNGFGSAIQASDDIDGDGAMELVVASPGYTGEEAFGAGRVQLVRSSDSGLVSEIFGLSFYNRLGTTLAPTADIDGDGVGDILVGSFWDGTLLLVSGVDLSILRDLSMGLPANRAVNAGGSVDFDGDGVQDWLIGSPGMAINEIGQVVGGIRVISGADGSTLLERIGKSPTTAMGQSQAVLPGVGVAVGESRLENPETGGSGAAYLWMVSMVLDSDGDGYPDDEDEIPFSNMSPTIIILDQDTAVANFVGANGVTLADMFDALGSPDDYNNPMRYFSSVVRLANQLVDQGLITDAERKSITDAARSGTTRGRGNGNGRGRR